MGKVLAVALTLLLSGPAPATALLYTFSGVNGLSGSFTLDETAPFIVTDSGFALDAVLTSSPLNRLSGSFGNFAFEGDARLFILDIATECCGGLPDDWIVRSDLTGPPINGLTPAKLNLFIFRGSFANTPISLIPPSHGNSIFEFSYSVQFTDGSFVIAPLLTLVMVPEPSSLVLLALGFGVLRSVHRYRRTHRTH